jgi:hypothetical protein
MTSDPERLLTSVSIDDEAELERELLRSIVDVSPPAHAKREAWDGIASRLAAASAVAAGASVVVRTAAASQALPAAASAAKAGAPMATGIVHALATKVVVGAVVAIGATAAVGTMWSRHSAESERAPATRAVPGPSRSGATVPPTAVPEVAATPAEPTVGAHPDAPEQNEARAVVKGPVRQRPEEALAVESSLLTEARASLRKGDPGGALAVLRRLDQKAPHGVLRQEREVLTIQALAAAGDTAAASRRAKAFVDAYPNSPHSPLLRRLTSEP